MLNKIISGGQSGADRAALDAALDNSFPAGGFCPAGRLAEDGPIDEHYPLEEIAGGYRHRTRRNVEASEGTVIFYHSELQGGSALTERFCQKLGKPCLLVDMEQMSPEQAEAALNQFISTHRVVTLNVAGPRASSCPSVHAFVYAVIARLIALTH